MIKTNSTIDPKKFPYFAICIMEILLSKYPKTYIVGGAVRNILLGQKVKDVDITTSATPQQVIKILRANKISLSSAHEKFGVIIAKSAVGQEIEIATFRKEVYGKTRFPKVTFVKTAEEDSQRRDFTMNAIYYSSNTGKVLDFHDGLKDVKSKSIKFIGNVEKRITEDPLRIVRAYRFSLQYNLKMTKQLQKILQQNNFLLKTVSEKRIEREINLVLQKKFKKQLQKVIHNMS